MTKVAAILRELCRIPIGGPEQAFLLHKTEEMLQGAIWIQRLGSDWTAMVAGHLAPSGIRITVWNWSPEPNTAKGQSDISYKSIVAHGATRKP